MSHLTIETLARLVDEVPAAHEAAHLELCEECRIELEGLRADAAALAALPEIEPAAAQWSAIERRLRQEGLMQTQVVALHRSWWRPVLQMAAALAIFALGGITTNWLRSSDAQPAAGNQDRPNTALVTNRSSAPLNIGDAQLAVRAAETAYLDALTRYTELAGATEVADPLARLAALESIVLTTRAALGQAPADPVINGYHLTAVAQRDATIKRLASTSGNQTWF